MLVIGNIVDSSDILREIRLLEHFSQTPLFCKLFSRASLFGEQSIASLPKKHSFLPKEALLSFRIVVFLYKIKQKSVLNFLLGKNLPKMLLFLSLTPCSRRASKLCLEDAVKLRAGREATLGRDDIIAIVRKIHHHLFGDIKTNVAEPNTEGGT